MAIVNISTRSDTDFVKAFSYMQNVAITDGYELQPISLVGAKLKMGVRKVAADYEEFLLLTTENGGIVIFDAENGKFYITIAKSALIDLPVGTYEHSLVRIMSYTDQDFVYPMWKGTLTHAAGPSR